ncbi:MAG TPA: sigma-70 family RNA polymerase sigma factor [Tepidisphaeraceae bacterium]|nr:sigma-70 family RNA polymerase sigma factor [Tepidisphaeraceae bacterium]
MTDAELLKDFSSTRNEKPFCRLVDRYIDFVHASASRQVRDSHLADDVTQAVFIVLSQKAGSVPPAYLPGWLLGATRRCAKSALRLRARRFRHEQQAAAMKSEIQPPAQDAIDSREILFKLDDALASLPTIDRGVVALRFLQGKSLAEVGASLSLSENAAQKRLTRALYKLQGLLKSRGVMLAGPASLVSAFVIATRHTAPPTLAATINPSAFATLTGTGQGVTPTMISKGAANFMLASKAAIAAIVLVTFLLLATGTLFVLHSMAVVVVSTSTTKPQIEHGPDNATWPMKFDVVESKEAIDQPATLAQIKQMLRTNEDALQNLRVESAYSVERTNASGKWEFGGEGKRILWIDGKPAKRFRAQVDHELVEWIAGAAPFSEDIYVYIWDGVRSYRHSSHSGAPGPDNNDNRGTISNRRFLPNGTGWELSQFGFIEFIQAPAQMGYPERLSDYFDPTSKFAPALQHVILNGDPMIRAQFIAPRAFDVYLDAKYGYAIRGVNWARPDGTLIVRAYVETLRKLDAELFYPGKIKSEYAARHILTTISSVTANLHDWPDSLFTMNWNPGEPVWDEQTRTATYPAGREKPAP